ncbi:hypothetical protein EAD98_01625 [Micromonospora sp. CV4]|nr:hypothetical protein EAD98_01625 [Micromonospora sp. CV4]
MLATHARPSRCRRGAEVPRCRHGEVPRCRHLGAMPRCREAAMARCRDGEVPRWRGAAKPAMLGCRVAGMARCRDAAMPARRRGRCRQWVSSPQRRAPTGLQTSLLGRGTGCAPFDTRPTSRGISPQGRLRVSGQRTARARKGAGRCLRPTWTARAAHSQPWGSRRCSSGARPRW